MLNIIINLLLTAVAVVFIAYILPGVTIKNYANAIIVALLIGVMNVFVRPIMVILTFPITIITLGLFWFVINALIILLVSAIVPGFKVKGLLSAILFSIILSLINMLIHWIL